MKQKVETAASLVQMHVLYCILRFTCRVFNHPSNIITHESQGSLGLIAHEPPGSNEEKKVTSSNHLTQNAYYTITNARSTNVLRIGSLTFDNAARRTALRQEKRSSNVFNGHNVCHNPPSTQLMEFYPTSFFLGHYLWISDIPGGILNNGKFPDRLLYKMPFRK